MDKLADISLKNRSFTALLTVVIAVLGAFSMVTMKQELIPSVELPQVMVMTVSPGATSEQMKERVSVPIEQQVATIPEVVSTETQSMANISTVTVELEYGTDLARATSKIDLAVNRANTNFPDGAEAQVISGGTSNIPLAYVAVTSKGDAIETAERIRNSVIPKLEKIKGISSVQVLGAPEQIVRIGVDTEKIQKLGIESSAIQTALEDNGLAVPVGSLVSGNSTANVTVGHKLASLDELRNIPVQGPKTQVTLPDGSTQDGPAEVHPLSEIATVELTGAESSMVGRLDGKDALALMIFPTANANIVETTANLDEQLADLEKTVGNETRFSALFEQAPYITGSVKSLASEGIIGLVFAVMVILLFLLSVRSTLVTAISIPLSLLVGFIGMMVAGYTVNMLTLAALTLTIGRVVDDSIVVVENIKRHSEYGKGKGAAIMDAVREVAGAVTASALVSLIVFLPIGLVSGMVGELFRPFAFTVIIALAASLLVSLTIVPVLAYWFLKPSREARLAAVQGTSTEHRAEVEAREDRYWLRRAYRPAFDITQRHPAVTLVAAVLVLGLTVAMFPLLKINLLGTSNMGMVTIQQQTQVGLSTEAMVQRSEPVAKALKEVDGAKSVATIIGAATQMGGEANSISYLVSIDQESDIERVRTDITAAAKDAADGDQIELSDQSMLGSGSVDVDITAPDPDTLQKATELVYSALKGVDGAGQVKSNLSAEAPAVQVTVNRDAAAKLGLTENAVVQLISAQMVEPEIGTITLDNIDTSIFVSIANPVKTVTELREMQVMGRPITEIANIDEVHSIPTIVTKNGQQTATVSVTPATNDNVGSVSDAVAERVDALDLPDGTVTNMSGISADLADSFTKLVLAIMAAILLIYVVLVWIFKSLRQPLLLLISIPFAAIGSFLGLLVTGTALDISAMVGLLMLTGIVVTNAVVLIDLMNQYRERGDNLVEAIRDGAMRRLRPIIMTAVATIAAMLPMAFGLGSSSSFISQPLAITVIGGLISSTLLTLVLLPVIYRLVEGLVERNSERRAAREAAELAS